MGEWRCERTGNPVGTDTVMIGAPACMCRGCRRSRFEDDADARKLLAELERELDVKGPAAVFRKALALAKTAIAEAKQ